jgi:hypothetical protein
MNTLSNEDYQQLNKELEEEIRDHFNKLPL